MTQVNAPAEMIEAALTDAESRSTTARADIRVLSAEAVTWSDGSLGCPQPGMMYTQALVPGYRIVLQAGQQTLNYHAMSRGKPVFCPASRVIAPAPGEGTSAAWEAERPAETALAGVTKVALDDAVRRTRIDRSQLEIMTAESVVWPNGALGCPQDDTMYTPAAVPGYRIQIRAGMQVLDYHAGMGGKPSLCPRGQASDALSERLLTAPASSGTDRVSE